MGPKTPGLPRVILKGASRRSAIGMNRSRSLPPGMPSISWNRPSLTSSWTRRVETARMRAAVGIGTTPHGCSCCTRDHHARAACRWFSCFTYSLLSVTRLCLRFHLLTRFGTAARCVLPGWVKAAIGERLLRRTRVGHVNRSVGCRLRPPGSDNRIGCAGSFIQFLL